MEFNPQFNWKYDSEHLPPLSNFNHRCDPFGTKEGKNTVKLRIKDEHNNTSHPYEFKYIHDKNARNTQQKDQLTELNSPLTFSATNPTFNTAKNYLNQNNHLDSRNNSNPKNRQGTKRYLLPPRPNYTHTSAIQIKSFRQSEKDKLIISGKWMDQGRKNNLLKVINHDRALNDAARSQAPLIYNHCDGRLYRNGNEAMPSLGDSSEGGLLAILQNSPTLTLHDFSVG